MKWNILRTADDERAVSPVIGVILMVAVTVILAAVVSVLVLDMGNDVDAAPQASLAFDYDNNGNLSVTHEGGDSIKYGDLAIRVTNSTGTFDGNVTTTINETEILTSGESFNVDGLETDDVVRVVWRTDGDTAVLAKYTVP